MSETLTMTKPETTAAAVTLVGFDHMQMEVRDLEEAIAFWGRHFGFAVVDVGLRLGMRWAIVRSPGNLYLSLHENQKLVEQPRSGLKITHFGLVVEDFEPARERLLAAGVKIEPDYIIAYERSRSFYFYDPSGHKVEVSEVWGGGLA